MSVVPCTSPAHVSGKLCPCSEVHGPAYLVHSMQQLQLLQLEKVTVAGLERPVLQAAFASQAGFVSQKPAQKLAQIEVRSRGPCDCD